MNELIDRFGRKHETLRISVTDRCQMRCVYCLPNGAPPAMPKDKILSLEEFARIARIGAEMGIRRVRITGGEPLLRRDLHKLVRMIRDIEAIKTIALTTNALLLKKQLPELAAAGLDQISISLDAVTQGEFEEMTGLKSLATVKEAIESAKAYPAIDLELNAVALRGFTERTAIPLIDYASENNIPVRFIEMMPFEDVEWKEEELMPGKEIESLVTSHYGEGSYEEIERSRVAAPSRRFRFKNKPGGFGLIEPVSNPFCAACDRLRVRSDGTLYNCLFGRDGEDLRTAVRSGDDVADDAIREAVLRSVASKGPGGMLDFKTQTEKPARIMASIGG